MLVHVSAGLDRPGRRVTVHRDGVELGEIATHAVDPGVRPQVRMLTLGERGIRAALLLLLTGGFTFVSWNDARVSAARDCMEPIVWAETHCRI